MAGIQQFRSDGAVYIPEASSSDGGTGAVLRSMPHPTELDANMRNGTGRILIGEGSPGPDRSFTNNFQGESNFSTNMATVQVKRFAPPVADNAENAAGVVHLPDGNFAADPNLQGESQKFKLASGIIGQVSRVEPRTEAGDSQGVNNTPPKIVSYEEMMEKSKQYAIDHPASSAPADDPNLQDESQKFKLANGIMGQISRVEPRTEAGDSQGVAATPPKIVSYEEMMERSKQYAIDHPASSAPAPAPAPSEPPK